VTDAERLATLFAQAKRTVVFTGAGVSTESGIPDFRSKDGVWARFDPAEFTYRNFMSSVEGRRRYWALGRATYPLIRAATPGPTHRALVALHERGVVDCCITQNIDGLHQRAGLPAERVLELHGNATRARCLDCAAPYARDEIHAWLEAGVDVPACPVCGGVVKPFTVLFGEAMPAGVMAEAERRARACDLFVVLGSSLIVYPAAYLPAHAQHAGARLVIVNLEATPLDARADLVIRDRTATTMAAVLAAQHHSVPQEGARPSWLPTLS